MGSIYSKLFVKYVDEWRLKQERKTMGHLYLKRHLQKNYFKTYQKPFLSASPIPAHPRPHLYHSLVSIPYIVKWGNYGTKITNLTIILDPKQIRSQALRRQLEPMTWSNCVVVSSYEVRLLNNFRKTMSHNCPCRRGNVGTHAG